MKKFDIIFAGDCVIEARNEGEAIKIFWELISENKALPLNTYDIIGTQEHEED